MARISGPVLARSSSPVLVGRDKELAALVGSVTTGSTVVLLEGEAGVGKTRLVRELLARTHLRPMVGHCQPLREPFPFGAVIEAFRGLAGMPAPALSPVGGALRPLLPELGDLLPPPPDPIGDPHAERHRTLRAARELVGAVGPAVLVIEDLHWADDSTRQMLRFLMSDPPENLSVVVTYRREDLAGRPPLGAAYRPPDWVGSMVLRLEPLGVEEVRELASSILGDPVSGDFAARLQQRTSGVPFVVEELLRSLRTPGRLPVDVEVPVLLRDAMSDQLSGLSALARRLVHAAAVLGVPAAVEQLAAVAGIEAEAARASLTEALAGGVLLESAPARYWFRHSLAQQAVYDALTGPARQQLHDAAIASLQQLDQPPLVRLAEHCRRAGRTEDWLRYGEQAADRATEVGDPAAATGLLHRLLAEPGLRGPDVDRLAVKLGSVAYTGLDQHDPVTTLDRLLTDERLSVAARGEVRLLLGLLLVRQMGGGVQAARSAIRTAIDELTERPDLVAKAAALLGTPFVGSAPWAEQREWMELAERHLARCADPEVRVSLLATMLGSRLHRGDPRVLAELSGLAPTAEDIGERRQLARARCNLADACTTVGHFREAHEFLRTGTRLAASAGSPFVVSTAQSTQVRLDWYTGGWTGLEDRASRLYADYRDLLPVASELELVLGMLAVASGDFAAAQSHLANTGVEAPEEAIAPIALSGYGALAWMWLSQRKPARAASVADQGLALLRGKGVWAWAADLAPVAVDSLLAVGRDGDARRLVEDVTAGVTGRDAPLVHAALEVCRGRLAESAGDPEAVVRYRAAEAAYARLPAPYLAASAAERAVRCVAPDGSVSEELAALAEVFDSIGATRDAARCRHGVPQEHGVSRRGRRGYGDELSPREQDVARLVSRGLTNKEIAEELFLSPRTVEQHVAKVLRKLGVRSRTKLLS
ncbi:helix-turn-helix transcriptional regulator [Nocardioides speluncae]|uniref:helix-turn-helix transcriptional regulator n=1 Tax=Nocardioides speluncae TaxID=2670337 RepID=UPI000D6893A7|nr:LuxR family transcriptional regulator [Nocardioides speluncae]